MASESKWRLSVYTGRFLGTATKCREFLDVLSSMDSGRWVPDRWGHFEPMRELYNATAHDSIVRAWTEERPPGSGRHDNSILFRKHSPKALIHVATSRMRTPALNCLWLDLSAGPFTGGDGSERMIAIARAMVHWSEAVYATASHSQQVHKRGAGGTPLIRLENLDWLTFFGRPYVEMFGRKRLLDAPFHEVREVDHGMLALATPRPDSAELTTSSDLLIKLEQHLGSEAFVGAGYPEVPCRVPQFDPRDTIIEGMSLPARGSVH